MTTEKKTNHETAETAEKVLDSMLRGLREDEKRALLRLLLEATK